MSKLPAIPDVPPEVSEEMHRFLDAIKRYIDLRIGEFDELEKSMTLQDLLDYDLVQKNAQTGSYSKKP